MSLEAPFKGATCFSYSVLNSTSETSCIHVMYCSRFMKVRSKCKGPSCQVCETLYCRIFLLTCYWSSFRKHPRYGLRSTVYKMDILVVLGTASLGVCSSCASGCFVSGSNLHPTYLVCTSTYLSHPVHPEIGRNSM